MPVIDGIIEGNSQFNADNKAGIDVSLVKGAFYVVDDLAALEAISENRLSNNQIVWFNYIAIKEWILFSFKI